MQIQRKALLAELSWVQKFVERKTTIPILSNIMFDVDGKRLTLTGTDLEIGGITSVEGHGRQKWTTTAPVAKLIQYLQKVDEEEVILGRAENHWLVVTHGTSSTRIAGMAGESFPELPKFPKESLTLGRLPLAIGRTAFAISAEESRFTLNGALLEVDEDEARLVATDGHRLSLAPLQVKGKTKLQALIPRKALDKAVQFDSDPAFGMDDSHAFFDWGQRKVVVRKLTGNFPDWRRVVGDDFPNHIFLPVKSTLKTIERVALYADERSRCVKFIINNGKLKVYASSVETGEAEGTVPVKVGEGGGPFEYGLNADYVTDFLSRTEYANVAFCWSDQKSASQFVTEDQWRYVVMPMRI